MSDHELLFSVSIADCTVETLASRGGNGGQRKNRRHIAVRITHRPSGAVGFSADERDQLRNKRVAWRRLVESDAFRAWHRLEVARRSGQPSVEQLVDEAMRPENLRIEVREGETWVPEQP